VKFGTVVARVFDPFTTGDRADRIRNMVLPIYRELDQDPTFTRSDRTWVVSTPICSAAA